MHVRVYVTKRALRTANEFVDWVDSSTHDWVVCVFDNFLLLFFVLFWETSGTTWEKVYHSNWDVHMPNVCSSFWAARRMSNKNFWWNSAEITFKLLAGKKYQLCDYFALDCFGFCYFVNTLQEVWNFWILLY